MDKKDIFVIVVAMIVMIGIGAFISGDLNNDDSSIAGEAIRGTSSKLTLQSGMPKIMGEGNDWCTVSCDDELKWYQCDKPKPSC